MILEGNSPWYIFASFMQDISNGASLFGNKSSIIKLHNSSKQLFISSIEYPVKLCTL